MLNVGLILTRVRIPIKENVRQKLLKASNFSCSICGKIPVVIHHIEEYAKNLSNEEKYLMPICRECHDKIHGKGGSIFSKKELYQYKKETCSTTDFTRQLSFDTPAELCIF